MGQRSQIYIRYNVNGNKGMIARCFQWNYGERMVSRARGIIEILKEQYLKYSIIWTDPKYITKLARICDINFDMRDIVMSTDIIEEIKEFFDGDLYYLFHQDNNDGQLLIDVTDNGIKYGFIPYCDASVPLTAQKYMKWNSPVDKWDKPREFMDEETIAYTKENIRFINENAELMSAEEMKEFLNADYSYLLD